MADDWRKKLGEIGDALRKKNAPPHRPAAPRQSTPPVPAKPAVRISVPNRVSSPKSPATPAPNRPVTPPKPAPSSTPKGAAMEPVTSARKVAVPTSVEKHREPVLVTLPKENRSLATRESVRLNVGLDFGTSSTKVCIRPTLGDGPDVKTYPIAFDTKADDPLFGPSTIGCKGSRFYFGAEAEALTDDCRIWRHIKVCLACEAENTFASAGCFCASAGTTREVIRGGFAAGGLRAGPTDLATLYIAWVMGTVLAAIPQSLRKAGEPILTCNIGVPVDQIDRTSRLHSAYERLANGAWRLRGHVIQGIDAATALGWLQSLKATEPSTDGSVSLCPETGAAAVAHIANPTTREGMYVLVDIGAWTTDISFFRLTDVSTFSEGIRTAAFYKAETHRVAAGRIDQKASELLSENRTDFAMVMAVPSAADERQQIFRSIRENGASKGLPSPAEKRAAAGCLECARSVTAAAVSGCFASTRAKAKQKEGPYNQDDWKRLSIFLLGGGSEEASFEDFLKWSNQGASIGRLPDDRRLHVGTSESEPARTRRLQVAAGLSFPIALWPKQFFPSQVERVPAASRLSARARLDRDELYPK
jgi:hypothetical protein